MNDIAWSDQVAKIVGESEDYWTSCLVPGNTIDELSVELESHVDGARQDGKPISRAIGSPREWVMRQAEDCRMPGSWVYRLLNWWAIALYLGTLNIIAQHTIHRTLAFPIGPGDVVLIGSLVLVVGWSLSPKLHFLIFSDSGRRPRISRRTWWIACGSLAVGIASVSLVAGDPPALVEWSWVYSLALILLTVPVVVLNVKKDPTRRAANGSSPAHALSFARTDATDLDKQRKLQRQELAWALVWASWFALCYVLAPPHMHEISGALLVVSTYWLAYVLFKKIVRRVS